MAVYGDDDVTAQPRAVLIQRTPDVELKARVAQMLGEEIRPLYMQVRYAKMITYLMEDFEMSGDAAPPAPAWGTTNPEPGPLWGGRTERGRKQVRPEKVCGPIDALDVRLATIIGQAMLDRAGETPEIADSRQPERMRTAVTGGRENPPPH